MEYAKILKYVNLRGLLVEFVLNEVLKPALAKVVADSDNKIDDMVVGVIEPVVEKMLVDKLDELLKKLGA